jgi:hypothetical protein
MRRALLALLLVGCDDGGGATPRVDAAGSDAAGSDAAGSDAGRSDAAGRDAARSDAGGRDAGGRDAGPAWGPRGIDGQWWPGDLHVHATGASNDTGGDSSPEAIAAKARERGLTWVVLTDHSNSTGSDPSTRDEDPALFNMGPEFPYWARVAELSGPDFVMVDGNEISPVEDEPPAPRGHIGCAPRDRASFDRDVVFVDRPKGEVTGGAVLAQALGAGCFATVNHPFGPAQWIAYDWTSRDYDAMEVFNGGAGYDRADANALKAWACDHALGKRTTLVGGSDNHRVNIEPPGTALDPPLGHPATWIFAPRLDWEVLVGGLAAGRTSASDTGAPLELDVYDAQRAWLGLTGDAVPAARAAWLRVRGRAAAEPQPRLLRVYRVPAGACADHRTVGEMTPPDVAWTRLAEQPVEAGDLDVALEVTLTAGDTLFATLAPADAVLLHYGVALSGAVTAE